MSRIRHRAKGGAAGKPDWYAGGTSETAKEAEDKAEGGDSSKYKKGGRVMHGEGEMPKHRADKRARGGAVGRKRGGGVGADRKPLSSAAKVKHVTSGEGPEQGEPSD